MSLVSIRTARRLSSYNSVIPSPESLPDDPNLHPLKRKFEPVLLDRFPRRGSIDESTREFGYPDYVPMFAFPNDIQVISSETRPRSTWHGFSMTAADGSRIHGVCIIIWIPMGQRAAAELDKRCEEWRRANLTDAERELAASLVERLAVERAKLSELLAQLPAAPSGTDARDELEENIGTVEERINMMSDMLRPLLHGSVSKIEGLADGETGLWVPRAYGILGKDSSMTGLWKEWLRVITVPMLGGAILRVPPSSPKVGMWRPIERYVLGLCVDAPAPTMSRTQTELAIRELRLYARREAANELPGSRTTDLYPLFRSLSIPNIVLLFEYVLQESRVILLSAHISMLQLVSKAIVELIWPLQWPGVFIPVLPARLIGALEAPCPYICGVDRRYDRIQYPDDDYVLVDLDNDEILSTAPPFQLPKQQRRKLQSLLHLAAPLHSNGVPTGAPAYAVDSFPADSFTTENYQCFSSVVRSTNLAKLVSINSASFGPQAASDILRHPPVFNAFVQAGSTRGRSPNSRPRTASTAKTSNPDVPQISPVSAVFPPLPVTPMSRNDSGFALQAPLREKRSGNFDSISSRRSGSISNATRRPSLPFVKHSSSPSTLTDQFPYQPPPAPSSYAPSTYATSTLAASTIMPGIHVSSTQPVRNTETTTWMEGHCFERQNNANVAHSAAFRSNCSVCDERPDHQHPASSSTTSLPSIHSHYRCTGCSSSVHARCIPLVSLPCPAVFFPDQIRAAFARSFAGLLYTYRKFLSPLTSFEDKKSHPGRTHKFDLAGFIRSLGGPGYEHAEYISMLSETQMWSEFIGEREVNPSTLPEETRVRIELFEAVVAAKRKRRRGIFGGAGHRLRTLPGPLGRRIFSASNSTGSLPLSPSSKTGRSADPHVAGTTTEKKDVLSDTSEHCWRTISIPSAPPAFGTDKVEFPPQVMKGRDYRDIVTRIPAKLEDGFFVRHHHGRGGGIGLNGAIGKRRDKERWNGLGMNAP